MTRQPDTPSFPSRTVPNGPDGSDAVLGPRAEALDHRGALVLRVTDWQRPAAATEVLKSWRRPAAAATRRRG
jgi:hypothetical protein